MNDLWRAVEVAVPAHLGAAGIGRFVDAQVRIAARRSGEGVRMIRIGACRREVGDWRTWSASYLPGESTA